MRLPLLRVPTHHAPRRGRGGTGQPRPDHHLSRASLLHLAWSATVIAAAGALVAAELSAACPPGGPLAFGDCERVRPFAVSVALLAAALYVAGLSAVRWWTAGLVRRGVADTRSSRDWYLLVALLGVLVAPLLAFTLLSALR